MAYYFVGGEDHDFQKIGNATVDTGSTRRTALTRCSLKVGPTTAIDGYQATLSAAVSSFWLSARVYASSWTASSSVADMLMFLDGSTRRLGLKGNSSGQLVLFKRTAAGVETTLATSSLTPAIATVLKLDVQVSYGAANTINVYLDGLLFLTYTGDVTTNGATTLSGFVLGSARTLVSTHYWSEVICTTEDTRGLSLVTLPPAANGNAFAWTNSYASVDEVTTDDLDLCASASANQVLETTVSSSGLTGSPAIRAVCVSGRAQKGSSGPANIQMAVRTAGADFFSSSIALPDAFDRVANVFETNPDTSAAWTAAQLTAVGFNIGAKSIT